MGKKPLVYLRKIVNNCTLKLRYEEEYRVLLKEKALSCSVYVRFSHLGDEKNESDTWLAKKLNLKIRLKGCISFVSSECSGRVLPNEVYQNCVRAQPESCSARTTF
uniref:Uncharacterized protein n=1 Tax=Magallana gigas TaxID=29159 RepID=K1R2P5_MAGGI